MTSVLIVDDDQQLRRALQRDLVESGYEVRAAASVAEARACIHEARPDIVLTDLRMSEEDGIDLLSSIRELDAGIRSILMAAYARERDHEVALELGAVRLLYKPFTLIELLQAIRQAEGRTAAPLRNARGLSLLDVLQGFHHARQSMTLHVGSPTRGAIHVRKGEVVDAVFDDERGETALRAMLAMSGEPISTTPLDEQVPSTIQRGFRSLLLDLLGQLDEKPTAETSARAAPMRTLGRVLPGTPRTSRRHHLQPRRPGR
jgi:CheY-like chemotaxis protein